MSSRLANFCDKLLEAGWLAALIVAPLYMNVYSSRVFEPDKITLVRSIALVMVGAWTVRQIERGGLRSFVPTRAVLHANPLILPTLAIVIVYIISTALSVVPAISLGGSYQRLQGTYSTFSYITIFLIAASTLRTRTQLDRAVNTILATSLPIAVYGLVQHHRLDPLPWAGDTVERIAANMGNSIFVAAYLILVVPIALARWIETLTRATRETNSRWAYIAISGLALLALTALWMFDFTLGTAFALALGGIALLTGWIAKLDVRNLVLMATYTLILAAQLVAIVFSQSRGPWLGLAGGLFVFVVLYALARGARKVMLGAIGIAVLAGACLVVFNLPLSPLDPLKSIPYVGRLGQILETESGTGKVRELIWQGTVRLILPHQPLWSPTTGDDPFNAIRPLVGYGPEAMYVAFNPFYPPELGNYEARNASPDRSHNETFDSLVMTGLLGFGTYILLFVSVFYFGLKWLGMINTPAERNAFVALWLAVGSVSALAFGVWRGWNFVGVALPAGMILGFFIFLIAQALRAPVYPESGIGESKSARASRILWLCALLAAFIAHFIEINFGIAIVSTRTYFWFYAALLVIIGMNYIRETAAAPAPTAPCAESVSEAPRTASQRRRQRRRAPENTRPSPSVDEADLSPAPVVAWAAIVTLMLVTLAYGFINNQSGTPSPIEAVRVSLFLKGGETSLGIFFIFVLTCIVAGIIGFAQGARSGQLTREAHGFEIALFAVLSFTAVLWFVLLQTRWITQLGDLTEAYISILGLHYVSLFILIAILAFALSVHEAPRADRWMISFVSAAIAPILTIAISGLIYSTNFASISADIVYKAGSSYDAAGAWDRSIQAYQRALALQPTQDFYALFLGRAYLEAARSTNNPTQRTAMINASEKTLFEARRLNPLNTDHSANLARLNRIVATMTDDPVQKTEYFRKSSEHYQVATRLSPNTGYLYNEWSQTYALSGDLESARVQLEQSLALDKKYAQTYLYLGEYYRAKHEAASAVDNYLKAIALDPAALSEPDGVLLPGPSELLADPTYMPRAIEAYQEAAKRNPKSLMPHYALAELYRRNNQLDLARQEYERAVEIAPDDYMASLSLVNFLSEAGQIDAAVTAMRRVMGLISPARPDYARFQEFNAQLQVLQGDIQAVQKSPSDVNARRTLATRWKARGQAQFALKEYEAIVNLVPTDYDAQKNLTLLNLQVNHPEDAQRALVTAVSLSPETEKPLWQNVQAALNAQKAGMLDAALKAAQAALALAANADKPSLQAYVDFLQRLAGDRK